MAVFFLSKKRIYAFIQVIDRPPCGHQIVHIQGKNDRALAGLMQCWEWGETLLSAGGLVVHFSWYNNTMSMGPCGGSYDGRWGR